MKPQNRNQLLGMHHLLRTRWLVLLPALLLSAGIAPTATAATNTVAAAAAASVPGARRLDFAAVIADAATLTTNLYPDADTVLVDSSSLETYNPDGTSSYWSEDALKVLTEAGRRATQVQRRYFNVAYGTATVARAFIVKPDGLCITVDVARASRVMTEPGQMSANIYDPDNKIMQLSLPGLEVGDLVYTETLRRNHKARVPGVWSDYSLFEYTAPIRRLSYAISAPAERPLRHLRLRDAVSNRVEQAESRLPDGRTLHQWEVRDVPQVFPEPNMPPLHTVVQRLMVSTAEDWPSLSRWYWELCQPRLAAVTPGMGTLVTGLVAQAATPEERVRRIFTWVSQNIRYMGITTETEAPGYEPHDVSMTFNNRYGVCRDKAALLVAMLRLAGLEAYPVLIHVGERRDPDVPMTFFNHAIVAVRLPGATVYTLMDPTNESTRDLLPAYLGNRSYLVAHPKGESLRVSPVSPAADNLVRVHSRGTLDETGRLTLETLINFEGVNDTVYRGFFARQPREQRRRFFEGLVKARLAGAELTAFEMLPEDLQDTDKPLTARLTTQARDFLVQGSDRALAELPWLSGSLGYASQLLGQTGLRTRRFDLETELACGLDEVLELDLGTAVGAPLQLPGEIAHDEIGIRYTRGVAFTNGVLRANLRFLLERPSYPAADYAALKQIRRDMEYAARQRAQFAPGTLAAAPDSRILDDLLRVELASSTCWTTTHHRVQRILTYAGTKRFSEVKLDFNPAWQTAELLQGVVTNASGRVHQVKPEEINVMDAPWAGGAPRYPAGRTRVVSLPGVETGSVTVVTTRRTQEGAPFFSLQTAFRGHEPIDRMAVEIVVPAALPLRFEAPGGDVQYSRREEGGGRITHRWEVRDQPALAREDRLPPAFSFLPVLRASIGDWAAYADSVRRACNTALADDHRTAAHARELTAGIRDPLQRLRIVRDAVMRGIRPAGPLFTELPLELTPVDRTLAEGYGHAADRALVMTAMLRAVGFEAEPLLADGGQISSPLARRDYAIPRVSHFDTCLVAVRPRTGGWLARLLGRGRRAVAGWPGDGRLPIYLNDSDQYAEPGTTPHVFHAALDAGGEIFEIEVADPYRPLTETEWHLDIGADGTAAIEVVNRFSGSACGAFRKRFREMPPEPRNRHFQELIGAISQSAEAVGELETDLEGYPGVQRYRARAERYAVREGDTLTLLLPGAGEPFVRLRDDRRELPLWIQGNNEATLWMARVVLPAGAQEVVIAPPDREWSLPGGLGRLVCTTRRRQLEDGRIEIELRRETVRGSAVVPPEQYPALLEINRRLEHPEMRTLVVRVTPP